MTNKRCISLCVFIDAFGWQILKRESFLDDVLVTKAPLGTIFGYSSTCDPTILTGKLPREHGHFSFFCYDPDASPFAPCRALRFLPRSITRRGRVRRLMSRFIKRLYGYTGYFQIYNMPLDKIHFFDYSEKRDLYEPGGINSGIPTIFDYLRDNHIPFCKSDWRAGEESNLAALNKELRCGDIRFAYLYLAAMDAVLHQYGARSRQGAAKIQWYEEKLRTVLATAHEQYDKVRLFVFSDHGMTDVIKCCPLMERIEALGLEFGKDFAAVYDSTMARFWFLDTDAERRIIEALRAEPCGRILSEEDLRLYGCDFPDGKYGELFFLLDPGILLCPSFMGEAPLAGMHGYAPEDKDSTAMFATNVKLKSVPERLDDLYGLMYSEVAGEANGTQVEGRALE